MSVFSSDAFDGHEKVVFCHDRASGLRAVIAIHDTTLGPALGGCRMWPYASEEEAVRDALRLSRGMTYKAAVAGLDLGGGKSVIIGDSRRDKTDALLRAMGRAVDALGGRYITAEDVGMSERDMDVLRQETPFARGSSEGCGNPSPATAYGVFVGIRAAVRHALGRDDLKGVTVAVQGLGSVGSHLCGHLAEAGARLVVADINAEAVARAVRDWRATPVASDRIHAAEADVFAPCALGAVINDDTLPEIRAKIVAGSANNQLAEPRHGAALMERGILYAPDYVINAGGLIDVAHEGAEYDRDRVMRKVARIEGTLTTVFDRAAAERLPTAEIADRLAEARLNRTPQRSAAA